eukprot:4632395-Heterocapsa_arctica.AAC.1
MGRTPDEACEVVHVRGGFGAGRLLKSKDDWVVPQAPQEWAGGPAHAETSADSPDGTHPPGDAGPYAPPADESEQRHANPLGEVPCVEHELQPCDAHALESLALIGQQSRWASVNVRVGTAFAAGLHCTGRSPKHVRPDRPDVPAAAGDGPGK